MKIIGFVLGLGFCATAAAATTSPSIILEIGESVKIKSPLHEPVWLNQNHSIKLTDTKGPFLQIQARRLGQSLLNVGGRLYTITVIPAPTKKAFLKLKDFLKPRKGLKARFSPYPPFSQAMKKLPTSSPPQAIKNPHHLSPVSSAPTVIKSPPLTPLNNTAIFITGTLLRLKDFKDLHHLAQNHHIDYFFSAQVPNSLKPAIKNFLKSEYQKSFYDHPPLLDLLWSTRPLTVQIPKDPNKQDLQKTFFKQYGILTYYNAQLLNPAPLVELKILLVELSRHQGKKSPFSWNHVFNPDQNQAVQGKTLSPPTFDPADYLSSLIHDGIQQTSTFLTKIVKGSFQQWLSAFQAMEHHGQAHILAHNTLLSESGKTSQFHAGGEVPIPHHHPETGATSIQWKPYGLQIGFQSQADSRKNIHIQTKVRISEVDHSYSMSHSPAIKTNSLNSSLTLQSGQTLALSTLLRWQGGEELRSPWLVSQIPLMKNQAPHHQLKTRTRLHIFITAQIKE